MEVFAGTAKLAAAVKRVGLGDCFGVDARVRKAVHAPILKLDLLARSGQDSLFALLNLHTVVAVHVSPPCRTTCRSQDKEHPLRSEAHPAGVPDLQPQQLVSVREANTLISFCASLAAHCQRCGILFSCEHPARSFMWEIPEWRAAVAPLNLLSTSWHQCMYGAALDVFTQAQHNIPGFSCLAARCSKNHKHILAPVTKDLVRQPALCRAWAECLQRALVSHGATEAPKSVADITGFPAAAGTALVQQPRVRRMPPMVPEFSMVVRVLGPASALPAVPKLLKPFPISRPLVSEPVLAELPKGARSLALSFSGGEVDQSTNCDNRAESSAVCELRHFSRELLPKDADVLLAVLSEGLLSPLPKRRKGVIAESSIASSKYYVLGAFQHSDRRGITAATTQYAEVASIVNEFAKALLPGCSWTSIAISKNEFLSLHCDAANLSGSRNHTMTLGSFSGGLLFLEDPDGEDTWTPPGGGDKVRGCNVVNLARFFSFDARSVRHATQPWKGDRWSITLFSAYTDKLSVSQLASLAGMGFPLPSSSERPAVAKYGIPWTPAEFITEAHHRPHPAQSHYLPGCLEQAIVKEASEGLHSIAKARTEVLRRWILRRLELAADESELHQHMPRHIRQVLEGKQLLVFKEMLASQGTPMHPLSTRWHKVLS